ncbi:MAG: DUF6285 domain-containing protein [Anaerolineae bacterium]|nr:DUF6285 domain-containing protein [Anaerolineae bacterium]
MTDRPTLAQLLEAVQLHLESHVIPAVRPEPRLYFQTLVALNLLKIAQREVQAGDAPAHAEAASLSALIGQPVPPAELPTHNHALAHAIRTGDYDAPDRWADLSAHVGGVVGAQLMMNAPQLAQRFKTEDETGQHPH